MDEEGLASAARLVVLRQAGLSAHSDEGMERFARLVASVLAVPVALVSLDERTCTSPAIDDLGVVAYAGMPLTDGQGRALGSLCAIDQRLRAWSPQELADLDDLAVACSGELRLWIMSQYARRAQDHAERARKAAEAARLAAERSDAQARAYAAQATVAPERSQLVLRVAADLASAGGLVDVRRRVRNLVSSDFKPSYVGLVLLDGLQVRRIPDPETTYVAEIRTAVYPLDSPLPSARAARHKEIVVVSDRSALEAEYGPAAAVEFDAADLQAAVCLPLPGTRHILGVLILGWATRIRST